MTLSEKPEQIVVVDNGSHDGSQNLIRSKFPEVTLVEMKKNSGFTGANNAGLGAATGDILVLLNNDCIVEKDWLSNLLRRLEDPRIGAVASSMRNINDIGIMDSAGGQMDWMGFTADIGRGEPASLYSEHAIVPFACGGALMVRRSALPDQNRIFWNDLFIYQEDVDLGLELNRTGWEIVYEPTAVVRHEHSATMRKSNYFKEHLLTRNRLLVMRKHFGKEGFSMMEPYVKRWQHAWIAVSILRGRFHLAKALLTGTSSGLKHPVEYFPAKKSIYNVYARFAGPVNSSHPLKRTLSLKVREIIQTMASSDGGDYGE